MTHNDVRREKLSLFIEEIFNALIKRERERERERFFNFDERACNIFY